MKQILELKELIREGLSKFEIAIISQAKKDEFKDRVQKKYVDSVVNQLKESFPYVEQIARFCLVDPSQLPSSSTYGNGDLKNLCDYNHTHSCASRGLCDWDW